jgi:endonuclease/exonuclease/phosphatase family metal-dependent hydrolase
MSEERDTSMLRVASANLEYGGLSATGDATRLGKMIDALRAWDPDIILMQELTARSEPGLQKPLWDVPAGQRDRLLRDMASRAGAKTLEHMKAIAAQLGMTPVSGPPTPMSSGLLHPAIMVRTGPGLQILQTGPPSSFAGPVIPAWSQVIVSIGGIPHPVAFYSIHMPARSAVGQLMQAEWLATFLAQRGELAVAGGDWNCYGRADELTDEELRPMPPHLRPPRMRWTAGGVLAPNYAVEDTLALAGMRDAAACLPPARREPRQLTATARDGNRIDRFYVTPEVIPALCEYRQHETGGSDHQAILLTLTRQALAEAEPPGPVP